MMKLSFKGIFNRPNDKYRVLNHYRIYRGWWIEERTVIRKDAIIPSGQLPWPEFRIYGGPRQAKIQNFRGLVSGTLSEAKRMVDARFAARHFLEDEQNNEL
jgi:hypothetical protein